MVPIVIFDQIYSFDRDSLLSAIPRPRKNLRQGVCLRLKSCSTDHANSDNAGATDEHRALTFGGPLSADLRSSFEAFARQRIADSVGVQPSPLSGTRKVVEIIFSFTHRSTDVVAKNAFVRRNDEFHSSSPTLCLIKRSQLIAERSKVFQDPVVPIAPPCLRAAAMYAGYGCSRVKSIADRVESRRRLMGRRDSYCDFHFYQQID
jgi:hypothetical protein